MHSYNVVPISHDLISKGRQQARIIATADDMIAYY
jgi:hypothetical protein